MCPPASSDDDDDPDAPRPPLPSSQKLLQETALKVRELVVFAGERLPPSSATWVLAQKEAAVAPLLEILVDSKLRDPSGEGAGWGPVHAAKLLGRLRSPRAIEPLLDILATTAPPEDLAVAVSQALTPLGVELISPILARLPTAVGSYRLELWCLLAGAKVRDARIFDQLLAALAEQPEEGAMRLAEYGDRAALPHLSRALYACKRGLVDDTSCDHLIFELREAIENLGGKLTAAQQTKYEYARITRKVESSFHYAREQPYDPDALCFCGSGRQYRYCCLQ